MNFYVISIFYFFSYSFQESNFTVSNNVLDESCFEYDVIYSGSNIYNLTSYSSVDICKNFCYLYSDCHYWTYDIFKQICYVKYEKGEERYKDDFISGALMNERIANNFWATEIDQRDSYSSSMT